MTAPLDLAELPASHLLPLRLLLLRRRSSFPSFLWLLLRPRLPPLLESFPSSYYDGASPPPFPHLLLLSSRLAPGFLEASKNWSIVAVRVRNCRERESAMGRILLKKLDGSCYMCRNCHTHLAEISELISKAFHCKHGKAYLFNTVVNVTVGKNEERVMTTGLHVVADIYCICCQQNVGWKYESAYDQSQKYKEGKFILEREKIDGERKEVYPINSDSDDV